MACGRGDVFLWPLGQAGSDGSGPMRHVHGGARLPRHPRNQVGPMSRGAGLRNWCRPRGKPTTTYTTRQTGQEVVYNLDKARENAYSIEQRVRNHTGRALLRRV